MAQRKSGGLYVDTVVRRYKDRSYTSHLLRRSYRAGGKVKKQTLGNITHLPPALIDLVRRGLAGETFVASDVAAGAFAITRSLPHGHVAAVLGMIRTLGLAALLSATPCRERELVIGMIVSRILAPASKLATSRTWGSTTLGETVGSAGADENELYAALDWLLARQPAVERALARRHLEHGALVLYDVSSTYVEGRHCALAQHGYSRDHRPDRPQIVFGVVLDDVGRPVALEAFAGNTADPATVERQLEKVRDQFGLHEVVLVGDRGMLTQARIDRLKELEEFEELGGWRWISCLRAPAIQALVEQGAIQLSLFDARTLVEVTSPAYPGERLLVCKNPLVAAERARKREVLLTQTEQALAKVATQVERGRLKTAAAIGLRVGRVVNRWQMAKHFTLTIGEGTFTAVRQEAAIAAEAALDGLYVVRTNVPPTRLGAAGVVSAYKSLSLAERVFRTFKTTDLAVRPVYHYKDERVRAHLFLCLLAAWRPTSSGICSTPGHPCSFGRRHPHCALIR